MRKGNRMMRLKRVLAVLVAFWTLSGAAGCTVEGYKDGINEGVSTALSALISTPILHALDQQFAEPG
jgi:hypothetical protein